MEDRLIKFAKIVNAGSFTKAAALLHISQPALTSAVKKLEKELKAELLIRGNHNLQLTRAGQIAYESAQALTTETKNLQTRLQQTAQEKVLLNLGLIDSLATTLFIESSYLTELKAQAQVSLIVDNTARLVELTAHNELDIALVAQPRHIPAALRTESIGKEPLLLVTHRDLLPELQAQIKKGHLQQIMSYNQASYTYQLVNGHFGRLGLRLTPSFYSTSPDIMLQLVLARQGAAVLPYLLVKPWLVQGTLIPVAIGGSAVINRDIVSVQRRGYAPSAAATAILEQSRQRLGRQAREAESV